MIEQWRTLKISWAFFFLLISEEISKWFIVWKAWGKKTLFLLSIVHCFFFSILQHFSKKSRWTAYGIRIARQIFKVGLLCLTLLYQVLWKLTFLQDPTIQWLVEPLLMAISWSNCVLYDFISLLHFNLQAFIYPLLF